MKVNILIPPMLPPPTKYTIELNADDVEDLFAIYTRSGDFLRGSVSNPFAAALTEIARHERIIF
jgi:hypothetical protein